MQWFPKTDAYIQKNRANKYKGSWILIWSRVITVKQREKNAHCRNKTPSTAKTKGTIIRWYIFRSVLKMFPVKCIFVFIPL